MTAQMLERPRNNDSSIPYYQKAKTRIVDITTGEVEDYMLMLLATTLRDSIPAIMLMRWLFLSTNYCSANVRRQLFVDGYILHFALKSLSKSSFHLQRSFM